MSELHSLFFVKMSCQCSAGVCVAAAQLSSQLAHIRQRLKLGETKVCSKGIQEAISHLLQRGGLQRQSRPCYCRCPCQLRCRYMLRLLLLLGRLARLLLLVMRPLLPCRQLPVY